MFLHSVEIAVLVQLSKLALKFLYFGSVSPHPVFSYDSPKLPSLKGGWVLKDYSHTMAI